MDDFLDLQVAEPDPAEPTPIEGPLCEVCHEPIPWSGRGRKPKRCAEHKTRTASTAGTGASPRTSTRKASRLATLEDGLLREMVIFGKAIAKPLPVTGVSLVGRAEKTAKALTAIAATNDKVLNALEVVTKIVPALDLSETIATLGVAFLVDTRRIAPDGIVSTMLGVDETWRTIYGDESVEGVAVQNGRVPHLGLPPQQVPSRFQPVGV